MRRSLGCSVLGNPSLRDMVRPVPVVLVVAVIVLAVRDALDIVTSFYTWTPDTGDIFGWNLPPLLVASQILSNSFVCWLGAPLSLLIRVRRELPPRMQQQLISQGAPEHGLMCALVRVTLLHALLFWLICAVLSAALAFLTCRGSFDPTYIDLLSEAGIPLPPGPLPVSCTVLSAVTAIPPMLSSLAALAVIQAFGSFAVACAVSPMLYLAKMVLPIIMQVTPSRFGVIVMHLATWLASFNTFQISYGGASEFSAALVAGVARAILLTVLLIGTSVHLNRAIVRRRL